MPHKFSKLDKELIEEFLPRFKRRTYSYARIADDVNFAAQVRKVPTSREFTGVGISNYARHKRRAHGEQSSGIYWSKQDLKIFDECIINLGQPDYTFVKAAEDMNALAAEKGWVTRHFTPSTVRGHFRHLTGKLAQDAKEMGFTDWKGANRAFNQNNVSEDADGAGDAANGNHIDAGVERNPDNADGGGLSQDAVNHRPERFGQ